MAEVIQKKVSVSIPNYPALTVNSEWQIPWTMPAISIIYPIFVGFLLLVSFFFPPLLLLNMPILLGRAAYLFWKQHQANENQKIHLDSFVCRNCSAQVGPWDGLKALPPELICQKCGASHRLIELE